MSDPNEGESTLKKEQIEPEEITEVVNEQAHDKKEESGSEEKKVEKNQSGIRSSLGKSHSEDSLRNEVNLADSIIGDGEEKVEEVVEKKLIPVDFFYSELEMQEFDVPSQSPINEKVAFLDQLYGHDSFKNYNAMILDRDTLIFSSGISYTIYNHYTKEKQVFYSRDRGGIGAVAVHPSKKYFAVAEKGSWPNIYIYEYPSLRLYRVIRKGTERSFSCITFSGSGDLLASVGSDPDFLLTVWEWKQEQMILKSKAFSQEVYRVNFSQFNQKWITTSGTGHIRFWRISSTFTGMKLKGDIAKFGQIQLSDVASFAEFEDSNVISSSEYGKLLLWEGNLIRSVVSIDENTPCHTGKIEFVKLVGNNLITAGSDGYVKFWDGPAINTGESDEQFNLYAKPTKEIYFEAINGGPAHLVWIDMSDEFWIVQDALGRSWKYELEGEKKEEIVRFNSGKFTDFALSPLNNCLISTGSDGVVRLWDYGTQKEFYNMAFQAKAESTCIEWLPFSKKNYGRMVVAGFSDGIVRFLFLNDKGFSLVRAFKVHKNKIMKIKSNREGTIIVVSDSTGSLFFISLESPVLSKITPYCLFETGFKINDLCWDRNGEKVLLACNDGRLHEVNAPKQKECDNSETFLKDFQLKTFTIKMMESQKPNREELELEIMLKKTKGIEVDESVLDVEWEPAPILNAIYYDVECSKVLCSVDGKYLGYYYIVDFGKERPVGSIEASTKIKTSYLGYSESTDLVFIGLRNGTWEVRNKLNPATFLKKKCFDQDYGVVRKLAMNLENSALLSASEDGTLLAHKFDFESFKKGVRGDYIEDVQISIPNVILGISEATYSDKVDLGKEVGQDILDNTIYSLQDEKLKAEEDMKMSEAEKVKMKKLKKIKQLQEMFQEIVDTNNKETDHLAKLTGEDLLVDPEYAANYQKRMDEEEEETRKVLSYDEHYSQLALRKLEEYFVDELEYKKFQVKGIRSEALVSSFKLKKMSPYILEELGKIEKIIKEEEELALKKGDKKNKTLSNFAQSKAILDLKGQKDNKKGGKQQNEEVMAKIREAEAEFEKELAHAKMTKGQYNLKCSPNYVVPENERLNVSRKKKHLFLHYQYLFLEKKEFNEKLNSLRLKKIEMIKKLGAINKNLEEINKSLGEKDENIIVEIDEDLETMELDIEVDDEDIEEHIAFKQKEKDASKKAGGMGMGGGEKEEENKNKNVDVKKKKKKVEKKETVEKAHELNIKPRANMKVKKSALEEELRQIEFIFLRSEKQKIKSEIEDEITEFDRELESLQLIKNSLQSDLTMVEMKILTYAQEFIIFRNMETYDNELMSKILTFGSEKDRHEDNFIDLSNRIREIESVLDELKKKHEEEKKILKEFVYPEDDEMRERILRYYKVRERKRINKLKKQAEQEEKEKEKEMKEGMEDSDEEDEEDSEEESDEDSDEEFDEDEKPDITVIENDHKNFERVRKICEYDEKIEENGRKKSELEKERNQNSNKIKNLENELRIAEEKLKTYQKQKLLKINQLIVSYPVHLSQVQYLRTINEHPRLQEDFSSAILFTNQSFERLSRRIEELKLEKLDIEKKQRVLNKKLTKLNDSVSKASLQIENKRKEYEEKQLLKFGSTFELHKLKDLSPNDQVMETRELYKKEEREVSKKIESIKQELQSRKRELLESKKQNTKVITEITDLGERENDLKKKLDSTNKQLFKNYDSSKKDELDKERQNLKDLIKFLSKEIEDLKTEIGLFKRKGGHIYTMVTSNKKNFA